MSLMETYLREYFFGARGAFVIRRGTVISNTPRIISIQILRAIAALRVMFAHVWNVFWAFGLGKEFPDFDLGAAGVDLFFVISGFIIVYVSESLFGRKDSSVK